MRVACALGLLPSCLAPGHLGWEEAGEPRTSYEESLKSKPCEQLLGPSEVDVMKT